MSELNQSSTSPRVAPSQAPSATPKTGDGAAEVYRRAVQAKPTGFTENPIGAMASAMDKIGRAASKVTGGKQMEGRDGLQAGEQRLKAAMQAMRANPGSLEAKQKALTAAATLLQDMSGLAANDPRRIKISQFLVRMAGQLGPGNMPLTVNGLDMRGLLQMAAQTVSKFGSNDDMAAAFKLEGLLKASLPQTSVAGQRLLDSLMQRFGLTKSAQTVLTSNWAVRVTNPGEMPSLDMSSRTMVLDAAKQNPSLAIMARAFWADQALRSPQEKDGFIEAFRKIAQQSSFSVLNRKYRDAQKMARRELTQARSSRDGVSPQSGSARAAAAADDSGEMFAAVAVFGKSDDGRQLPQEMVSSLSRFYG